MSAYKGGEKWKGGFTAEGNAINGDGWRKYEWGSDVDARVPVFDKGTRGGRQVIAVTQEEENENENEEEKGQPQEAWVVDEEEGDDDDEDDQKWGR